MRVRGATSLQTNQAAATDAMIALARLLAREAARECLGQTSAPAETAKSDDRATATDAGSNATPRQRDGTPARILGDHGAASAPPPGGSRGHRQGKARAVLKSKEKMESSKRVGKPYYK
jgi:hypothetical protein